MSNLREAAQQALEEIIDKYIGRERDQDRLDAIRAVLTEPEPQEIADLRQACQEGWRYADELNQERKRLQDELDQSLAKPEPFQPDWANYLQGVKDGRAKTITITGTYKEFIEFVRMSCLHETIYDDSEGRQILVLRMLDAYGMAHSWAMEHTRNNLS